MISFFRNFTFICILFAFLPAIAASYISSLGEIEAESLDYDTEERTISASGNIKFKDNKGNEFTAEKAELKEGLSNGKLEKLKGIISNGANISADEIEIKEQGILEIKKAKYSPCSLVCLFTGGKKTRIWQIIARDVIINENENIVNYKDTTMEVLGVPVLYTPYLSHILDTKKSRSGFLIPEYRDSGLLGTEVRLPIFLSMRPNFDVEFTPRITTKEGIVFESSVRHLTKYGQYNINGSFTVADKTNGEREPRWHIDSFGELDVFEKDNKNDSLSFKLNRASDVDYLQKYGYSYSDMLRSHITAHKKFENSYHTVRALGFQTLNSVRNRQNTPYVLPQVKGSYKYNKNVDLDYIANSIEREQGVDQYKLSAEASYNPKSIIKGGHELDYKINLRSDFYFHDDLYIGGAEQDDIEFRMFPTANVSWKYPLVKRSENFSLLLEPTIMAHYAPDDINKNEISNEDSLVAELSDANLFNYNHFSGTDVIEEGTTVNYGVKGLLKNAWGDFNFLFGQSFHTNINASFSGTSGFREKFSDYIGRISFSNWLFDDLSWSLRLDHEDFAFRKNEISALINHERLTLDLNYISVNENGSVNDKEDFKITGIVNITDSWSIAGYTQRDLQNSDWIENGAELMYSGECVDVGVRVKRNYFTGTGIEPDTSVTLKLSLKTIGGS